MNLLKNGLLAVLFTMIIIIPVAGAQNIGVFRNSTHMFYLDYNGNGTWEGYAIDRAYDFGIVGDIPVSGDWNDDGISEIGVYRPSTLQFYLDYNGNGVWNGVIDRQYNFGGITGDLPVSGDWNDDGITEIGVFRPSTHMFYLDYNGNGAWNGAGTDRAYNFGLTGDLSVSGDWNNDGTTEIGVFRPSTHMFYLDYNGNGAWNGAGTDRAYNFGLTGDSPVSGDWNGDGISAIGVFRPSTHMFYLDYNGNGAWNGAGTDRAYNFGLTGDSPVSGKWAVPSQTTYKVYAEVGELSLVDSARGFWNTINGAQNGGMTWTWARYLIVMNDGGGCTHDCPRASHWTSNASQWIGQADFLFFSGHGDREEIIVTDDYDNHVSADNMMLNGTGRVKWTVFDSCKTLNGDDASVWRWGPSFNNGLHMLLGWQTDVAPSSDDYTNYRGEAFAELMKGNYPGDSTHYTMSDAWWLAGVYTYQKHPGHSSFDVWNAVMYWNECENDHLPGYGDICTNPGASQAKTWRASLVFAQNTEGSTNSLPVNLTVDNFSLVSSVPVAGNNTMIYLPVKSGYSKEWVSSLAKNLGMSGDIRETEDAFYGGDKDAEQYLFVVQKNSSMVLFRKTNNSSGSMQSETQSISAANMFLRKNNLLPSENLEPRVVNNMAVSFTRSGERIGEWKTHVVIYPQLINGLPIFNAQFNVEVDPEGNIIGLFKNWREYEPYKEISLKSPEDAFSEFRIRSNQSLKEMPEKVNVTKISLGYQMNQSGVSEYLEPVYIFEGYVQRGNSTESFEPVTIAANKEGVQDALIPPTPSYTPEVMNKITGNFSAPANNAIVIQNITGV